MNNEPALPLVDVLPLFMLGLFAWGLIEWALVHFRYGRANRGEYFMSIKGIGFSVLFGGLFTFLAGPFSKVLLAYWGASIAPFSTGISAAGWVYGFVIYEMSYWVQHWLAHKVRLLWCLHSPHHAPNSMNMFVGFNHSFLETIFYMPFMLGFVPALLGVDPVVIAVMTFIDVVWGNFLHVSDNVVTRPAGAAREIHADTLLSPCTPRPERALLGHQLQLHYPVRRLVDGHTATPAGRRARPVRYHPRRRHQQFSGCALR